MSNPVNGRALLLVCVYSDGIEDDDDDDDGDEDADEDADEDEK
jgi:hypothetical protein